MRSKEVERGIKILDRYKIRLLQTRKEIGIIGDFRNHDVEKQYNRCGKRADAIATVLSYISELEKETDELKIEKNNLINERDKLIEEYNKTGEFASNQIYREKNYINKQIIRDKINEIEMTSSQINGDYFMNNYKIQVLKELLGE